MKQGTASVLWGCHSVVHSLLVLLAWRRLYGRWPLGWQLVCIFLHDIGHWGLDYLSDFEQKRRHWELGASVGRYLFGHRAYSFLAGHCSHSGYQKSDLYKADKYSWYLAPTWWLLWNNVVEPELMVNCSSNPEAVRKFQSAVRRSIETGQYVSTHSLYLERRRGTSEKESQ